MDWIAALFEIIGFWLVGNKRKIGFLSCAACSLVWIYIGLTRPMYGLALAAAACLVTHIRNYRKWKNLDSMKNSYYEDIENSYHEGLVRGSHLKVPLPYDDIVGPKPEDFGKRGK